MTRTQACRNERKRQSCELITNETFNSLNQFESLHETGDCTKDTPPKTKENKFSSKYPIGKLQSGLSLSQMDSYFSDKSDKILNSTTT